MKNLPKILAIIGPTAAGKTKLAVELARRYNGEIISADSRQVYQGMDLGTGKDLEEYGKGKNRVKYHLIDVANPSSQFDLKIYQNLAYKAILGVLRHKKLPIIVGGSGLYLQAVVDGFNFDEAKPDSKKRIKLENLTLKDLQAEVAKIDNVFFKKLHESDKKNKRRLIRYLELLQANTEAQTTLTRSSKPRYHTLVIGINYTLPTLRGRIKKRLMSRLKAGMVEEVRQLHNKGLSWERLESFGLEYKYIALYLQNKLNKKTMEEKLLIASGQFAKRQMTWFRRWGKQGRVILWFKAKDILNRRFCDTINRFLAEKGNMGGKDDIITFQ